MNDLPIGSLKDARLRACATSAMAAFVFSADGTRAVWANAIGAALFDAPTPRALTQRPLEASVARQIGHLAVSLAESAAPRLARLRGFGGPLARPLTCRYSRIVLDGRLGLLLVAVEPAGPALGLGERVRRLLSDHDAAAFSGEGALLTASEAARERLGGAMTLAGAGLAPLAARAMTDGEAAGTLASGPVHVARLGEEQSTVVLVTFPQPAEISSATPASLALQPTSDRLESDPSQPVASAAASPSVPSQLPAPPVPPLRIEVPLPDLRQPLRFVWQMDADGRFTLGSDEFTEILGPATTSALGRSWDAISAELALDPDGAVRRAVDTRDTWSGVKIAWPIDGSDERLTIELSGLPLYDRDRVFRGYRGFGVCRESERLARLVAQRRAALAAPILCEAAPESAREGARDTAAVKTASLVVSENVVPFPGPPPEARSAPADGLIPALSPVERSAFREIARQLSARLQFDDEEEPAVPPDADEVGAGVTTAADPAEPERFASASFGRRRGETGIQVLDQLPVGILIYRFDQLLYANRMFLDAVGYASLDELRGAGGLDCLFVESVVNGDPEAPGKPLAISTARTGKVACAGRLLATTWNGESAMMIVQTAAISVDADQAQDRRAREKLELELRSVRRELDKANAAKADLLAKISHGVRTPLNSIIGFSEVMLDERFGPIGNERYRAYLEDIRASGAHVLSLVGDMLELSRMQAGQVELTFANIDLNEIVNDCVGEIHPHAARERVIVRSALAANSPRIVADTKSVRQIIVNMLSNSIKLTGPGGQVIVSTGLSARGVVFRIRHTGPGMSESEVTTALEPFRHIGTATRSRGPGAGLGLPLSKALAEANRGTFAVSRRVKDGTLVEVAFPPAVSE